MTGSPYSRENWSEETEQRIRALRGPLRPYCKWSDTILDDDSRVTPLEIAGEFYRALRRAERAR